MSRPRPKPRSWRRLPDPTERAVALALKALSRRELTAAELRARLEARRVDPGVVEVVVERLQGAGGLDDERYARLFAEDKRALNGWGEERIRAALVARGVAGSMIDRALAGATHDGEIQRALEQLERRGEPVADEASRGRAYSFLVRRGYGSEVAYDAIRQAETAGG